MLLVRFLLTSLVDPPPAWLDPPAFASLHGAIVLRVRRDLYLQGTDVYQPLLTGFVDVRVETRRAKRWKDVIACEGAIIPTNYAASTWVGACRLRESSRASSLCCTARLLGRGWSCLSCVACHG